VVACSKQAAGTALHLGGLNVTADRIARREFITLLVAAASAISSSAAEGQDKIRQVGVLMSYAEADPEAQIRVKALEQGLQKAGWKLGRNLRIDYHWAGGDRERFQRHAAELAKSDRDVVLAVSTPAVKAMLSESKTIPIVFTQVSDPIGQGIVGSLAKPGGAITGFTNYDPAMSGKWLGLLKEAAPGVTRAAVVFNPQTAPYIALYMRSIEAVAPSITVKVTTLPVHDDTELETALAAFASKPGGGLIVMTDAFTSVHRDRIVELAARLHLPAVYPYRYYAAAGGLMSYGIDQVEQFHGAATYVDRILKGARPGDLPVQAPTRFQLVINLKAAKAFGQMIPVSFLLRADELIE
jgi:putative ABC transport system substrate-binding protein